MGQRLIATILTLRDQMSAPLMRVSDNVTSVSNDLRRAQRQVGNFQKGFVKSMDRVATAGLALGAIGGAIAIKIGFEGLKELEEGSAKVKSIAGDSLKMKSIQKDLLAYSNKTGISINELSETQYEAISSGVKASESIKSSVIAAKLSTAGFTDSASALKVLTATMNVYGLTGTKAMESISDKMLLTQNLGVTTVAELSSVLGDITPIAKSAGIGIDDVLGSVASLTKGGMSTSKAVTNLKGVVSAFIKPSSEAQKTMKKLGIDMSVAAIKSKGFPKVMEEIKTKTKGNTEVMGKLFGSVEALAGALALTSDTGMKDFISSIEAMGNATGATEQAYKTMVDTLGFKLNKTKNTFKNTFTSILNTQAGSIGKYLDRISAWLDKNQTNLQAWVDSIGKGISQVVKIVESVSNFAIKNEKLITTILVFITSIYLSLKAITLLKGAMTTLNTIGMILNGTLKMSPLGKLIFVISAVVTAGYLLYRNWDMIKNKLKELGINFSGFNKYIQPFMGVVKNLVSILKNIFKEVIDSFKPLWESIKVLFKQFSEIVKFLIPILTPIITFIAGVFITRIVFSFLTLVNQAKAIITAIAGVLDGVVTILSGIIDFVIGVFTGNWSRAWNGIKNIISGIVKVIGALWRGVIDFFLAPVDAVINILDAAFKENIKKIKKLWQGLKEFLKHPIKGIVNLFQNNSGSSEKKNKNQKRDTKITGMQKFARGGISRRPAIFGEAGAEIAIPLNSSRRSQELLGQANYRINRTNTDKPQTPQVKNDSQIILHFNQPIYGMKDFENQVAKAITNILGAQKSNLA